MLLLCNYVGCSLTARLFHVVFVVTSLIWQVAL